MLKKALTLLLVLIVAIYPCLSFADNNYKINFSASTGYSFRDDYDNIDKKAKSVFLVGNLNKDLELVSTGSGFVCFDEHLFVTNQHVIDGADSLAIIDDNDNVYFLDQVVVSDKEKDIAILLFPEGKKYESLDIDTNEELKRGQPVVTIGSPEGYQNTVAFGNISAFLKVDNTTMIQFTAPVSHGSSGGCLFDDNGKVIGVTSAGVDEGQNIGFAIPIKIVNELYDLWDKKSYVKLGSKRSWDTVGIALDPGITPTPISTPAPTLMPTAEATAIDGQKNYVKFEDAAIYVIIPDSVMYVTMYSSEDAPLYALLNQIGFTYDSFREFMSSNMIVAYGLFLTDYETEFQIAADRIAVEVDLTNATDAELQYYLILAKGELENYNAKIVDSGIYKGTNYTGFWFHYQIEANGAMQGVIQYTILHSDRAINIRAYNLNGEYPEDAEAIIRDVFNSIVVN